MILLNANLNDAYRGLAILNNPNSFRDPINLCTLDTSHLQVKDAVTIHFVRDYSEVYDIVFDSNSKTN